jgi:endonuclease YncB( thermonuclease family)
VKRFPLKLILLLIAVLSLLPEFAIGTDFTGPVVSVLDGNTIEVLHSTHPECIQLSGIDCPEKGQPNGNAYGPPFGPTLTYRSDPLKEGRSFSCYFSGYPRVRKVVQAQKNVACPFFLSFTYPLCCYITFFP